MNKKQTTTKGFATLSIAGIINKVFALAYIPIQTAIIGNAGNGVVNQGYKIYIFLFALSTAGIPVALSKLISEQDSLGNPKGSQKIFKVACIMMIGLGVLFSCLMIFGAGYISRILGQPDTYLMIQYLGPALIFTSISSVLRGYFQGKQNMIPTAISQVIEQILNSILTIVFIYVLIKYGIDKAAAGSSLATVIGAVGAVCFLVFVYIKYQKNTINEINLSNTNIQLTTKEILMSILKFMFPAILGYIALNASDLIDLILVRRMIAGGIPHKEATELYGIFTTQYQRILNIPLILAAALPSALIPALSAAIAQKDKVTFNRKFGEGFKAVGIIIIPSAVGLAVLAKPIISFIFFHITKDGSDLMTAGSWVVIIMAIVYVQNAALFAVNKTHIPPINLIIGMIVKFILVYVLAAKPDLNVKSAIIATIMGYLISAVLNQFAIKKHVGIPVNYLKLMYKSTIASVFMGITAFLVFKSVSFLIKDLISYELLINNISLFIAITISLIVYLLSLIAIKGINSNDIIKLPLGNRINNYLVKLKIL